MADKAAADTIAKDSPYALFETNKDLERNGVKIDYGPFYFTIARAGGANTRFRDVYRKKTLAHQRAMATNTLPDALAEKLSIETFGEATVLGWGSVAHGPGKIENRDGSVAEFNLENVIRFFTELPDLARDLMEQSQNSQLFKQIMAEEDAKN